METFGILKLLSALSGAADNTSSSNDEKDASPPPQQSAPVNQTGFFSADERARRAAEILEKHDAALRRVKKNNPHP